VKYGAKYASLKTDDPYEISPERALEVIREKEIADANRLILDFPDAGIQVLNGRYGPYITDKQRNAKIPKDKDPKSLSLEVCQALLAAAPVRTFGKWGRKKAAANGAGAKAGSAGLRKAAGGKHADVAGVGTADIGAARVGAGGAGGAGSGGSGARGGATARRAKAPPSRLAAKEAKAAVDKKAPRKMAAAPKPKARPKPKKKTS
jgi:DNA topoisomerase-1